MRNMKSTLFLMAIVGLLSACSGFGGGMREELNVLNAQVGTLEKKVEYVSAQEEELREIIAGEQKRGEYLQRQITQMVNNVRADINAVTKSVAVEKKQMKPAVKASTSTAQDKFISDKMANPPSISNVQTALRNAGHYTGNIDGTAGPQSSKAVKEFQKSNGLTADGVVGAQTWEALKKYL